MSQAPPPRIGVPPGISQDTKQMRQEFSEGVSPGCTVMQLCLRHHEPIYRGYDVDKYMKKDYYKPNGYAEIGTTPFDTFIV